MIGRILRLLFALPVALAVAAGLYYYWFSSFLNQKCDGCVGDQTRVAEAPSRLPDWVEEIGAYCDCGWRLTFPNTSNSYTRSDKATPTAPEPVKCDEDCNPSRVKIAEDALQLMSAARSPADNFLAPLYPKACRAKAASGAVTVEFDITPEGAAVNARIVSSPDRCFNAEVLRAVSKYRYPPATDEAGRAAWRRGVRETIIFELNG